MKQNKTKLALMTKVFGGLCLVALLVFNVTSVVNKETLSGLSLSSLVTSAQAQAEGDDCDNDIFDCDTFWQEEAGGACTKEVCRIIPWGDCDTFTGTEISCVDGPDVFGCPSFQSYPICEI